MTNEIKEILEALKSHNDIVKEYPLTLSIEEQKILLDYITNLQEENERYKKIFEGKERFSKIMPDDMDFIILSKADYDRQQEDIELTAIKMKQRIDKAKEYILHEWFKREQIGIAPLQFSYEELQNILNILRGDE